MKYVLIFITISIYSLYSGVEITLKTENLDDNKISEQVLYLDNNFYAVKNLDSTQTTIYYSEKEVLYTINPVKKSYTEITKNVIENLVEKIKQLNNQLDHQFENLPETTKKELKGSEKTNTPDSNNNSETFEYRKTGEIDKINGYPTQKVIIFNNNQKIDIELWIAEFDALNLNINDFKPISDFFDFIEILINTVGKDALLEFQPLYDIKSLNGYPIKTVNFKNGEIKSITKVTDIKQKEINLDDFTIPSDFKKETLDLD